MQTMNTVSKSGDREGNDVIGVSCPSTTNIKAYARVRPFSDRQVAMATLERDAVSAATDSGASPATGLTACIYGVSPEELVVDQRVASAAADKSISRDVAFMFDKVFWSLPPEQDVFRHPADRSMGRQRLPFATQEYVFEEIGKPAMESALNGVNASVFAFGQTGSGKSYTMLGTAQDPGLAPRCSTYLFSQIKKIRAERFPVYEPSACCEGAAVESEHSLSSQSLYSATVTVGMFEIYNERIVDLLGRNSHRSNQAFSQQATMVRTYSGTALPVASALVPAAGRGVVTPPVSPRNRPVQATSSSPAVSHDVSFGDDVFEFPAAVIPSDELEPTVGMDSNCMSRQSPTNSPERSTLLLAAGSVAPIFALAGVPPQPETIHVFKPRQASVFSLSKNPPNDSTPSETPSPASLAQSPSHAHAVPAPAGTTSTGAGGLRIRHDPLLGTYVEGLRQEVVEDAASLHALIQQALRYRTTARNHVHDLSSRSHAILHISVVQEDKVNGTRRLSTIHLVDLAGSERGARHGAMGQQLVESKKINLSLTTLRRVIDLMIESPVTTRTRRASVSASLHSEGLLSTSPTPTVHLPVRDSKLTEVMAECFGGNCLASMIATVSPYEGNITETLDSMRYCTKAKGIVNRVRPNEERIAVAIASIQQEMERLQGELRKQEVDTRVSDMERYLKRHQNVRLALQHCIQEKQQHVALMKRDLISVTDTAESYQRILEARKPLGDALREVERELETTQREVDRLSALVEDSYEATRTSAKLFADELEMLRKLESAQLPEVVRRYLTTKRKKWAFAIRLAASEWTAQQAEAALVLQNRALQKQCSAAEDQIDCLVDRYAACGSSPEWETYRSHHHICRERAVALAAAYEGLYSNQKELRCSTAKMRSQVASIAETDLRQTSEELSFLEITAVKSMDLSASLIMSLEAELDRVQSESTHVDEDIVATASSIHDLELRVATQQQTVSRLASSLPAVVDASVALTTETDVLERELAELRSEVDTESNALHLLDCELQDVHRLHKEQENTVQQYLVYLMDAEHAARTMCLPDAKAKYSDPALANAVLSVDRVNQLVTPRKLATSRDRSQFVTRSISQESRTSRVRDSSVQGRAALTPRQHEIAQPTPLAWKYRTPQPGRHQLQLAATQCIASPAIDHLQDQPVMSPRAVEVQRELATEDF